MNALTVNLSELNEGRILSIRLAGRDNVEESLKNVRALGEYLTAEPRSAVILDCRDCIPDHTPAQFAALAQAYDQHFPRSVRIAIIYGRDNMAHTLMLTRLMKQSGIGVMAFAEFEPGRLFAQNGETG